MYGRSVNVHLSRFYLLCNSEALSLVALQSGIVQYRLDGQALALSTTHAVD